MTELIKIEGIIIKKKDINDSDRLLTVFTTAFGKISLIFKGINKSKRRDKTASDVLSLSKMVVYKKDENYIASTIDLVEEYENTKTDIDRIGISLYICSVLNEILAFGERNSKIYDMAKKSFRYIDKEEIKKSYLLLCYFVYKIINEMGVGFSVEAGQYFSIENSYIGAKKFSDSRNLSDIEVEIIKKIYFGNVAELLKKGFEVSQILKVIEIFENYLNYHMDINLNLKKYILGGV